MPVLSGPYRVHDRLYDAEGNDVTEKAWAAHHACREAMQKKEK